MAEADARSMLTIARRDLKAAWILQDASIAEASWGFPGPAGGGEGTQGLAVSAG